MQKYIYVLLFFILIVSEGFAQEKPRSLAMQQAIEVFDKFHYVDAAKMFESIISKESGNIEAKEKLAMCYRKMNDSENAEKWFASVVIESAEPMNKLYYAQALAQNQHYDESKEWYQKFAEAMRSDKRGKEFALSYADVDKFFQDSERYTVELAPFNSKDADFSPAYYKGGIVFCSSRPREDNKNKLIHKWIGKRFLDLYYAPGGGPKARPFSDALNTPYHEGSAMFYNDFNSIIFTRNNYNDGKFGTSSEDINKLKLFFATQGSSDWTNIKEFDFNDAEYSIAHPTLSTDGQTLYFTSDMPGSIGGTDLWMCTSRGGSWSVPTNLGPEINTKGNESFPFIDANSNLFFASDGHAGLGGLDVFVARANKGKFSRPQNIGSPVNSNKDDFGLIFEADINEGYFSSNREGGVGDDDIYKFSVKTCDVVIMVIDEYTKKIIPAPKLTIFDKENKNEAIYLTESDSTYVLKSFLRTGYDIKASKEQYKEGKSEITEQFLAQCKEHGGRLIDTVFVKLIPIGTSGDPRIATLLGRDKEGTSSGNNPNNNPNPNRRYTFRGNPNTKLVEVVTVYYDLDKYNIRPDASQDLEKVLRVMYEYPNMRISMSSHTDSRNSFDYNVRLAQRRSQSAYNYLINRGISPDRMEISSFGETRLVTSCPDGIFCSEDDHQLNRRTEIAIITLGDGD